MNKVNPIHFKTIRSLRTETLSSISASCHGWRTGDRKSPAPMHRRCSVTWGSAPPAYLASVLACSWSLSEPSFIHLKSIENVYCVSGMVKNIGDRVMDKKAPSLISGAYSLMEDPRVNTTLSISLSLTQQNS